VKAVIRRLDRLEDRFRLTKPRNVLRIILTRIGDEADLKKATCSRSLSAGGFLMELVNLKGCNNTFTSEEMDRFVESFPITRV